MTSWVDAASQQTYFIVSGSPSNTMLGGGDQNTAWDVKSCRVNADALQQTYSIVRTAGNTREGRIDPFLMGRVYLTFCKRIV